VIRGDRDGIFARRDVRTSKAMDLLMLSSDAGIPLPPPTVEAYRLLAATLRAYGVTEVEMRQFMSGSAKEIVNLPA